MPPRRPISSRAFTLIELLVVISIITVLCAILVPTVGRARARAKKVACGATLHGLSIGIKAYLSQYSERYPAAAQMPSVNTSYPALSSALIGEVSSSASAAQPARAWHCPADTRGYLRLADSRPFDSYFAGESLSFEYNMNLGAKRLEQYVLFPILGTTGTLVLADFDAFHGPQTLPDSKNLLFADAHVGPITDIHLTP